MHARILLAPLDELERRNEDEILLQRDALGGAVLLRERLGHMDVFVRFRKGGKGVLLHELGRHGGAGRNAAERLLYRVAHRFLGERSLQTVHGHDAFQPVILLLQLEGRVDHGRRAHAPAVLDAAVKEVVLPRVQVVFDVRRVEPDGGKALPFLLAPHLDEGAAAVVHDLRRRGHAAGDERHVVVVALRNLHRLRHVEVAARIVAHEVFRGKNIQFVEVFFPLFGNTLQFCKTQCFSPAFYSFALFKRKSAAIFSSSE